MRLFYPNESGRWQTLLEALPIAAILCLAQLVWTHEHWGQSLDTQHSYLMIGAAALSAITIATLTLVETRRFALHLIIVAVTLLVLSMLAVGMESKENIFSPLLFMLMIWIAFFGALGELIIGYVLILSWVNFYTGYRSDWTYEYSLFVSLGLAMAAITTFVLLRNSQNLLKQTLTQERRLATLLATAGEGYLGMRDGDIIANNPKALELLECSQEDIIGVNAKEIFPRPGWARKFDGHEIAVEVFRGQFEGDEGVEESLFFHDITRRHTLEHYRDLQYSLTQRLSQEQDLALALRDTLDQILQDGKWTAGSIWLYTPSDHLLTPSAWVCLNSSCEDLAEITWASGFRPDEHLIGQAFSEGQGMWVWNGQGPRWGHLSKAGITTQLLIPMFTGESSIGVIELLDTKDRDRDTDLEAFIQVMMRILTQFVEKHHAQINLENSRAVEINDDIVQSLTVAEAHLQRGEYDKASRQVNTALQASRRIMSRLIGNAKPGDLIRRQ